MNVLNRILEATPSVDPMSLIHPRQSNYEAMYCFDVSGLAPKLYLQCRNLYRFATGCLLNAKSTTLCWVYLEKYRSRMTGEILLTSIVSMFQASDTVVHNTPPLISTRERH